MTVRRKVQTALLLDPPVRDRADILAVAMDVVRAEVLRRAIEGRGLEAMERKYEGRIGELISLSRLLQINTVELARALAEDKIPLTAAIGHYDNGAKTYDRIRERMRLTPASRA